MDVYEFTSEPVFNVMFSIFLNIALVLIPAFAAISLARN